MALVKITNGFHNIGGKGELFTGIVEEGYVAPGDCILLSDGTEIPIIDVELDTKTFPGATHIHLIIPRHLELIGYKDYGKTFNIKNAI